MGAVIRDEIDVFRGVSRQRRYQLRKIRDGRCKICASPLGDKAPGGYCEKHIPMYVAWYKVRSAIRKGWIHRGPCEVCFSGPAEAHHDDYSRPLEVRWLCRKHHAALKK
jgi:hypothetical protein